MRSHDGGAILSGSTQNEGDTVHRYRFTPLLVAAVALTGLAACGSSGTKAAVTGTPKICKTTPYPAPTAGPIGKATDFKPTTAGTLTIVTSLPGPGFWEGSDNDPTKVTSGFEYDIANAMKNAFGLSKLVVRNEGFDAIVAGSVKNYDVALSQISITPDRAKVVDFSNEYFQSQQGVLVNANKVPKFNSVADARKIKWGVQTGTTAIDLLNAIETDSKPQVFQQLPDAYTALEAGQVDAVLIDTAINLGEAARSGGKLKVIGQFKQPSGPDHYGAILPKGSVNVGAVNAAFKDLQDSGKLKELADKDLTADPGSLKTLDICA